MRLQEPSAGAVGADSMRTAATLATFGSERVRTASFGGELSFAMPRMFDPARNGMTGGQGALGNGYDLTRFDEDENVRRNILLACRNIMKTHPICHACEEVYSRYPLQGIRMEHQDAEFERFYRELFLEDLDFESFLMQLGKTYWCDGTAFAYGNWSDELGLWIGEDILDPIAMDVQRVPFTGEDKIYMVPQQSLRDLANGSDPQDIEFQRRFPDLVRAIRSGRNVLLSSDRVTMISNKDRPSELWGTPTLMRCWNTLLLEDRMNSAMRATAERLYSPLVMFTIGGKLPDGTSYIPPVGALKSFRENLDQALSSDFRMIITHDGVKAQEVIKGDRMSNFRSDGDMYDDKIMMAWGLSPAMLKPQSGNYATSSLEFQLAAQMLSSYQGLLVKVYDKQARMVAEAHEHYEYEKKGTDLRPVYELREVWDDNVENEDGTVGAYVVREVPKLSWPQMRFDVINFRDEQQERKFRMELRNAGVPIADDDIAIGVDIDLKASAARFQDEQVEKQVNEARRNQAVFKATMEQGIVVPPDAKKFMESGIAPLEFTKVVERYREEGAPEDNDGKVESGDVPGLGVPEISTGGIGNESDVRARPYESDEGRGA